MLSTKSMIATLVSVLVFTALIGPIAQAVTNNDGNLSGAALTMYTLVTLLVVVGFVVGITKAMGVA